MSSNTFQLSPQADPNKVFLVNLSETEGRLDPVMQLYKRKTNNFKFSAHSIKSLLVKPPQYGANEAGIDRLEKQQPRYIRITDIDDEGTLSSDLGKTAEKIESKYFLSNNDILFARSGNTVGKAYIHKSAQVDYDCFFAGYMIRFIFNDNLIIPDYAFIVTQLPFYKEWVNAVQRLAGQPNINAEEYKNVKIPLPSIEIQEQIIKVYQSAYTFKQTAEAEARRLLSSIDDYILAELGIMLPPKIYYPEANDLYHVQEPRSEYANYRYIKQNFELNQQNELVRNGQIFLANFSEVSGGRFDPSYISKFEALRNIKSIYGFVKLKKLLIKKPQYGSNQEGVEYSEGDVRYIRITDIDDWGNLKKENFKTAKQIEDIYRLNEHDILFARSGSVGRCFLYTKEYGEAIFAGYMIRFVLDSTKILPEYLFNFAYSSLFKYWVGMINRTAAQPNINAEEYQNLLIPLPSIAKQKEIAETAQAMRQKAQELMQQGKTILEQTKREVEQMILGY